jgi:predicted nucleic acid-binding protein
VAPVARYLADKSALARLHVPQVALCLSPLIEVGLVATCAVIDFEILWSTRSPGEFDSVRRDRAAGYEWLAIEDIDWHRALEVQASLWATGKIRSVPLPDLLIAAVAERNRLTVVHYDSDYDTIAAVSGQPTRWVVEPGSIA